MGFVHVLRTNTFRIDVDSLLDITVYYTLSLIRINFYLHEKTFKDKSETQMYADQGETFLDVKMNRSMHSKKSPVTLKGTLRLKLSTMFFACHSDGIFFSIRTHKFIRFPMEWMTPCDSKSIKYSVFYWNCVMKHFIRPRLSSEESILYWKIENLFVEFNNRFELYLLKIYFHHSIHIHTITCH